jgi:hypothetical protein
MTALTALAIILFGIGLSGTVFTTLLTFMMTGEINRKRDDANQMPYFNIRPGKRMDMFAEYGRLYPEGRLHIFIAVAFVVAALGLGGAFVCLYLMGMISPPPPSRGR